MPTPQELNIPNKLDSILLTKQAIREAIVSKGTDVPEGTTFRQYADLIAGISTGLSDDALALADAMPEDVTAGKTFYAGDRTLKTGTAENSLVPVQTFNISLGPNQVWTFTISSKTFLMCGCSGVPYGMYTDESYAFMVLYVNGSSVVVSYNSNVFKINVSSTAKGFIVKLTNTTDSSISFSSKTQGEFPIHIFEG